MNKLSEILAPAGGKEQLIAAVRSGADAVYFGAKSFNARRNAQNFDSLSDTVRYCHERGVAAHITVNTLFCDDEREELIALAKEIAKAGADAVIVQDLGAAKIFKQCVPGLPLHASTQLAVHDINGVKQLEQMGFSRVVLSRELSLKEIEYIAKNTSLEVEVFIHGALCMSVSGCCYLSSMLGGRSGNRGLCAQPCRLDFKSGDRHFALSLKDMCHIEHIKELEKAGVCSFKIEGRMKRPEYAAAAVNACIAARNGQKPDLETLRKVFSRSGFTEGYLLGKRDLDMFGHRTKDDVVSADSVFSKLSALYKNEYKRIPLCAKLFAKENEPCSLIVTSDKGTVTVSGDVPQKAVNRPLSLETAQKQISKTGGTPFFIKDFSLCADDDIMLSLPSLNALRREALEKQTELYGAPASLDFIEHSTHYHPHKCGDLKYIVRAESFNQISGIKTAENYILPIDEILKNSEKAEDFGEFLFCELPALMFDYKDIDTKLEDIKNLGITTLSVENIGGIHLAKKHGFEIHCGHGLNVLNSDSLAALDDLGVQSATLSFELSAKKISGLSGELKRGIIGYGYLPLMRFRNCPAKGQNGCLSCTGQKSLTDRRGIDFPLLCSGRRYSTLLNSRPLVLSDKSISGIDFMTLYFTAESAEKCKQIFDAYKKSSVLPGEKTGGLYFRELL